MGDAGDLVLGVAHGVDADALAVLDMHAARLAEIQVPVQLAQDHHIDALDDFRPQRGRADQLREQHGGTEIGIERQALAQFQQTGARALLPVGNLVGRAADRAEQDSVGLAGERQGLVGQGHTGGVDAGLADRRILHLQLEPVAGDGAQHLDRLRRYLGADAVTGQHCDLHTLLS